MRDSNNFINIFRDIRTKVLLRDVINGVAKGLNNFKSCPICLRGHLRLIILMDFNKC